MLRLILALCLIGVPPAFAISQTQSALPELKTQLAYGPYCGIYSLFICLDSLGVKTDVENFVSPEFVGSYKGSDAKELIDAAEKSGAYAEVFANLTQQELYRIKNPMILHFRSHWGDGGYNHWVAFLGFDGIRVRILDAPHPLQTISTAELLANWDGTALIVSKEPIVTSFIMQARFDFFSCLPRVRRRLSAQPLLQPIKHGT